MAKRVKIIATNSNRVSNALAAAGSFCFETNQVHCTPRDGRVSCHSFRDEFVCQGYRFKSRKALNEWMAAEINGWMGESGLVEWTVLESARNSHCNPLPLFAVTEK